MLKPFHALKYLADNYLDEYNFFFVVSDGSFVNARRLSELVGRLSVSQDVYMGTVADDDSHYCTLEGGILLSNSVLRAVHNELDWCVRNSYSAHHHENIGRCVLHASHAPCTPAVQHQTYLSGEVYIMIQSRTQGTRLVCTQLLLGTPPREHRSVRAARVTRALHAGRAASDIPLRAVHKELDWCVRNSYSAHHHENIGRCVLHASHAPCTPAVQHQTYLSGEVYIMIQSRTQGTRLVCTQLLLGTPPREHRSVRAARVTRALHAGRAASDIPLRAVHKELDWCVRNSYSAHHHENIGRCVLHASHAPCMPAVQHQTYLSVRDENPSPHASLPDSVTAYPVTEPRRFHELHAYVSRVYLERDAQQVSYLRAALQHTGRKHPAGYRNASWPRGLRDDPGLAPPKPDNRFDHLRWTSFNATHAFMPDDHRTVGPLTGATAKSVQLVLEAAKSWALKRWSASDAELIEGSWRWEPATALRYRLLMKLQSEEGSVLRYLEVAKPLGSARLVPVPYVTESARVWIVVPADVGSVGPALAFLNRYEATCLNKRANTALVVVILRRADAGAGAGAGAEAGAEAGAGVREAVRALGTKHRTAIIHTAEIEVTSEVPAGSAGDEMLARSALEAALPTVPRDALLLLATPGMDFNEDFLNRVRMNSISGAQWFLPVPFARYAQYNHPRFIDEKGNKPQTNTGRFNIHHTNVVAVYRQDYETARSSAALHASVAGVLAASPLRCIQAPEPGLILLSPTAPPCGLGTEGTQGTGECLSRERDAAFTQLDLGAKHTLAKLLLQVQSEQA
ncbi:hypothetical protein O0L34_g10230 [Tuta absoluta]|nr:hypothetical protein O0L34_g10230 [Tuta absoluta]